MKKLFVFLSVLAFGSVAGAAFADDVVKQTTDSTTKVAKDIGNGTLDAANKVGKATENVAKGAGDALDSAAQGVENMVNGH